MKHEQKMSNIIEVNLHDVQNEGDKYRVHVIQVKGDANTESSLHGIQIKNYMKNQHQ